LYLKPKETTEVVTKISVCLKNVEGEGGFVYSDTERNPELRMGWEFLLSACSSVLKRDDGKILNAMLLWKIDGKN